MEPQKTNNQLQTISGNLSTVEAQAVQAYSDPVKVYKASVIEIKQTLAYIITLLGVTALPDAKSILVLLEFVRSNFGAFSLKEVRLAFDMAAAGKLDVDVNHYQQFTAPYFARIMNAYKVWITEVRKQYDKPVYKELKVSVSESEWRKQIQLAYDIYTDKTNFRLWPVEFYDQLTLDGFIELAYHEGLIVKAREMLCAEANKKMIGEADDLKLKSLTSLITAYRGKHKEYEVILLAKQLSVKHLFDFGKETDTKQGFYKQ